ncbi:MAG: M28 family peptidase [Clostridiaceae bacterium]|jgi:hypothetical protein|nr:M28 family peptidase [Clostridiaceae bacterium]
MSNDSLPLDAREIDAPLSVIDRAHRDLCLDEKFRVRRESAVKRAFFDYINGFFSARGYVGRPDGDFTPKKPTNLIFGDEKSADILLTAHYDTCMNGSSVPSFFVTNTVGIVADVIIALFFLLGVAIAGTVLLAIFTTWYFALIYFLAGVFWVTTGFVRVNKHNFNDNTSGCIALLELADRIASDFPELKDRIAFVFMDLEESHLNGSKFLHKKLSAELPPEAYATKKLINFDCIGGRDKIKTVYSNSDGGIELAKRINAAAGTDIKVYRSPLIATDSMPFKDIAAISYMSVSSFIFKELTVMKDIHSNRDNLLDTQMIREYVSAVIAALPAEFN